MYIFQSLVVLSLVLFTIALTVTALQQIVAMVRSGEPDALAHAPAERIKSVISLVFGHKKVLEDRKYGSMHMWYMYGFLILGIGHLEVVLFGLSRFTEYFGWKPFLYRNFLPNALVYAYEFSQDFMAAGVIIVVSLALYLRLSKKVKRLQPRSADAETILWAIGALYLTFFIFVGTETSIRMREGELMNSWLWYLPVSSIIALAIQSVNYSPIEIANHIGWWGHLTVFLGFAAYIPRSKHMHLLAAGPNIYLRHFGAVAKPSIIDFEKAEKFGVDRVQDLPWKSLLDTFACTECGRCNEVCPAHLTQKPLQPKKVLHDIKMNLRAHNWPQYKEFRDITGRPKSAEALEAEKAAEPALALINRDPIEIGDSQRIDSRGGYDTHDQIHLDEIWACTTCAACVEVCPVLIDSVPTSLIALRRNLVQMEAKDYPPELNSAFRGMENQGNPWGVGPDKRAEWAQELNVPLISEIHDREVEYLFWVGCAGATDDRAKKIQQALVRILKAAKVDFAILGCDEKCSGDPARRMGNEYLYDMLAKGNIEQLKSLKFKKIFATCPHCFNQLKNEYQDFDAHFSVQHHTELIAELLRDGRIPLQVKQEITETVTFHDPCYLGRYNDNYTSPRDALTALGNVQLTEMTLTKNKSMCCGAGGGRMFMEEPLGKRINHLRVEQAEETGAQTIATGCPFCMTMISDGVKDKELDNKITVKDVAELVAERLL